MHHGRITTTQYPNAPAGLPSYDVSFVVPLAVWDFRSRGRPHPVTLWGGLLLICSQPLRLIVSGTAAWLAFARWAVSLRG